MSDNILKLGYNGTTLTFDEETVDYEWLNGQGGYEVEVTFPEGSSKLYKNLFFVISNSANDKALEVKTLSATVANGDVYTSILEVPRFLKSGVIVNIGVTGSYYKETTGETGQTYVEEEGVVFSSNSLSVKIQSSINSNLTPDLMTSTSGLDEFLNKVNNGKTINTLRLDETDGKIYVKYYGDQGETLVGDLKATPQKLGLINTSGGGQVGTQASVGTTGTGFAGGSSAKATTGAAVGNSAEANSGFAGGEAANASGDAAIAIGKEANSNGSKSIVIGAKASDNASDSDGDNEDDNEDDTDKKNSIVIGTNAKSSHSFGVTIGASTTNRGQNGVTIGCKSVNGSDDSISIGKETKIGTNSGNSAAIGTSAEINSGSGAIAIGNQAKIIGNNNIAIGISSKAGIKDDGKSSGSVNGVAIGYSAKSSGSSAIGIGTSAKAEGFVGIAIGHNSSATATGSVSIGGQGNKSKPAKAVAEGAIQLGVGTNNIKDSLKFQGVTIVKNGAVCANLEKSEVTGILPIAKGGLGTNNIRTARYNLGIQSGVFEVTITSSEKVEKEQTFSIPFSGTPNVVLTIKDANTNYPYRFTAMLADCTKDKFKCKVQMGPDKNGKDFKGSNKIGIHWIAIGNY